MSWRSFKRSARATCSIEPATLAISKRYRTSTQCERLQAAAVAGLSAREVGRSRVAGSVVVLDPGAKPLGRVRELLGLEPGGILVQRLVQMFRSGRRECGRTRCEKAPSACSGGSPRCSHEIQRRSQPSPVSTRFAVDQERIGTSLEGCRSRRAARAESAAGSRSREGRNTPDHLPGPSAPRPRTTNPRDFPRAG